MFVKSETKRERMVMCVHTMTINGTSKEGLIKLIPDATLLIKTNNTEIKTVKYDQKKLLSEIVMLKLINR